MRISILTLFPEMFLGPFNYSIIKRAQDKKIVTIDFIKIRDFGIGKHKIVDDKPYGGGAGMVLRVDVIDRALSSIRNGGTTKESKAVLLDPRGKIFTQKIALRMSKLKHLILIAGHYEGVDERINNFVDEKISIGDYVLTGGEIPAMIVTDTIVRLIPKVIKYASTQSESFSISNFPFPVLEYPHYTKPKSYKNLKVPRILLSGDHQKIAKWREEQTIKQTAKTRPDLLKK